MPPRDRLTDRRVTELENAVGESVAVILHDPVARLLTERVSSIRAAFL